MNSIFTRVFSPSSQEKDLKRNYHELYKVLIGTMLFLTLIPVLITAFFSYQNYKNLLQVSEKAQLQSRLEGSTRVLTAMMDNILSVIDLLATENTYHAIKTEEGIANISKLIKKEYRYITDIGVINNLGVQQAYSGDYPLLGESYFGDNWFSNVLAKGLYISPVYLGHRNTPHFTIAVATNDKKTKSSWILRATINASNLKALLATIKTDASEDIFLVDNNNILQTSSVFFGPTFSIYTPENINKIQNKSYILATAKVPHTPWTLVMVEKNYFAEENWNNFTKTLICIFASCFIGSTIIAVLLAQAIVRRIQKTDALQVQLLQEAEHTDRLVSMGRLAAGVGHEINNPLAIINQKNGLAEDLLLLSDDFTYKQDILTILQSINNNVDRCKAITHRLLGFARRGDNKVEPVDVNYVIQEVLSFLENAIMYKKIDIQLSLELQNAKIMCNQTQLQQVFLNIINNSIDAVNPHDCIKIFSHIQAKVIDITIQDNGIGMSSEHITHLFEPFFTTKETGKGTGLGLSITYGLVKKMEGDIKVESEVGHGTTITITFPLYNN